MKGCIIALIALILLSVVTWAFGVILPQRLIGSGVEDFEGVEKQMAQGALGDVELHWGIGLDSTTFMVAKRVTSVKKCPGTPSGKEFERMVEMLGGYSAEIRTYTLFGIPQGTVVIDCDSGEPEWKSRQTSS